MADTVPTYKRKAIWWSSYKFWAIGDYYYTGSYLGSIKTCSPQDEAAQDDCPQVSGPPYQTSGLRSNVWEFKRRGEGWKKTKNEVIVECKRLNGK